MSDEKNPHLALQGIHTDVLSAAARGELDLNDLAREELINRGLDIHGQWVGLGKAAELNPSDTSVHRMRHALERVANLNPDAGEIGDGMLATIVYDSRAALGWRKRQ